ncbi:hypothetical protein L195_g008935 [Trifolium pratense]|uniref:Uncharacterized protein n=1 Tax=Trifolium pratense TaxID=57577 RepID=A0A2K3L7C9_TRIPR|nr:hypothetical protein L195_g030358 [Trifolium pratense]PNY12307.1 hypothetical protein L195_g008935 [Trifolium pratense]
MSINCSSWFSSHFSTTIDNIKHAYQRSWPSLGAICIMYSSRAEESGIKLSHSSKRKNGRRAPAVRRSITSHCKVQMGRKEVKALVPI